jgi:HTH-type transcriptional regulator/antitoxin HigA
MASISPIRTEQDYEAALARINELMDALSGPEGQIEDADDPNRVELDVLADLVEFYEGKHHPIELPSAVAAVEYCMDQRGLTQRDLIPYIGSRSKVAEVLSGKREITMSMARALNRHLPSFFAVSRGSAHMKTAPSGQGIY